MVQGNGSAVDSVRCPYLLINWIPEVECVVSTRLANSTLHTYYLPTAVRTRVRTGRLGGRADLVETAAATFAVHVGTYMYRT